MIAELKFIKIMRTWDMFYLFASQYLLQKNKYIFLSDQDDIWIDGRVNLMIQNIVEDDLNFINIKFQMDR